MHQNALINDSQHGRSNIESASVDSETEEESNAQCQDQPRPLVRQRRSPGYLNDYVTNSEGEENEHLPNLAVFCNINDPLNYDEAVKEEKWMKAMDLEI